MARLPVLASYADRSSKCWDAVDLRPGRMDDHLSAAPSAGRTESWAGEPVPSVTAETEQRYQWLLDHSPVGICVHVDGRYVYVNEALVRNLRGPVRRSIVGTPGRGFPASGLAGRGTRLHRRAPLRRRRHPGAGNHRAAAGRNDPDGRGAWYSHAVGRAAGPQGDLSGSERAEGGRGRSPFSGGAGDACQRRHHRHHRARRNYQLESGGRGHLRQLGGACAWDCRSTRWSAPTSTRQASSPAAESSTLRTGPSTVPRAPCGCPYRR